MIIGNRPQQASLMKLHHLYGWIAIEVPYMQRYEMGWHTFEFGFIYPMKEPEHGYLMTAEHYRGFIWRFAFWFPITRA